MGCPCQNKKPSAPKQVQPPSRQIQSAPNLPQPSSRVFSASSDNSTGKTNIGGTNGKFCKLCGWVIKPIQSFDSRTKTITNKLTCTNANCKNHI